MSTLLIPDPLIIYIDDFDFHGLRHNSESTAYRGTFWTKERELDRHVEPTEDELREAAARLHPDCDPWVIRQLAKKWRYLENDPKRDLIICARDGTILGIKPRRGACQEYERVIPIVADLFRKLSPEAKVDGLTSPLHVFSKYLDHNRGSHACLNCGMTMGGGDSTFHHIRGEDANEKILETFFSHEAVRSLFMLIDKYFHHYFPHLAEYYRETKDGACLRTDSLPGNAPKSSFCPTSLNFGLRTVCKWHIDKMNLVFGICVVLALGSFNHQTSGHFVMNEARVIMEFRPGDLFFNFSAFVGHRNSSLRPGEWRQSIVQYSPAGVFRWAAQGFPPNPQADCCGPEELESRFRAAIRRIGKVQDLNMRLPNF